MSDNGLLLHSFTVTHILDCTADPTKNRAIATFSDDVSPAFPYLNAVVAHLTYSPAGNTLTIRRGIRLLIIYPRGATLAKVDGLADVEAQLRWFQETCNDVWRRRAEITPCHERRVSMGFLAVYRLLPGLNCGACQEATCLAFARGLVQGERWLDECPLMAAPEHAEARLLLAEFTG
jgi:ArsR family metal-binding transcriptional regulator